MSFSLPFGRTHARASIQNFKWQFPFQALSEFRNYKFFLRLVRFSFFFFFLLLVSFSLQICRIKAQHLICVRCFKPCTTFVEIFSSLLPLPLHSVELFASHFDCCPCREFIGQLTPRRIDGNYNLN